MSGRLAGGFCTGRPAVFVHLTPGPTAGFPVRISALWATWCSSGARPAGPCLTFITPCRPDPCGRLRRDHQKKGGVPASSLSPLPFHASPLLTWFLCLSLSPQVPGSRGDGEVVSRELASDSALVGARPLGPGTPRNCSQIRRGGEVSSPQAASGQSDLKKASDKTKHPKPNGNTSHA